MAASAGYVIHTIFNLYVTAKYLRLALNSTKMSFFLIDTVGAFFTPIFLWRKVFPLRNEFKAQRELGAWLTIKLGKTRLKRQLACGEEPSLLCRTGIKPLTGTAVDKTELNLVPTAFILQRINSNNSARTRRNNRQSAKTNLLIYDFYNRCRQKNTIEI